MRNILIVLPLLLLLTGCEKIQTLIQSFGAKCETPCNQYQKQNRAPDCTCYLPPTTEADSSTKAELLQAIINGNDALIKEKLANNIAPDSSLSLESLANISAFKEVFKPNAVAYNRLSEYATNLSLLFLFSALPDHQEIFTELIARGADVNHQTLNGLTPIVMSVAIDDGAKTQALIDAGADVSFDGQDNILIKAIRGKKYEAAAVLAEAAKKQGAPIMFSPDYLATALSENNALMARAVLPLTDKDTLNKPNAYGLLPLTQAATKWNKDLISALVKNGADVNALDSAGYPPILAYLREIYIAEVEQNLEAGKQAEKNLDIVKLFADKGADLKIKDKNGEDILFYAVRDSNKPLIEFLIAKGSDINTKNNNGETPLFEAAKNAEGKTNMVDFLIQNGARAKVQDRNGTTPAMAAAQIGNMDTYDLLEQYAGAEY